MRQAMTFALVIFVLSCAVSAQTDSFPVGGQMRSYIVHAPSWLSNPPLVISMHGLGGTGSQQQMMTGFNKIADTAKFVVVYPNGRSNTWDISGDTEIVREKFGNRYSEDRMRGGANEVCERIFICRCFSLHDRSVSIRPR